VTIVGVSAIGLIHLLDSVRHLQRDPLAVPGLRGPDGGTIIVGGALMHRPDARWFAAAALLAATPIAGFILSRMTGLPGADDDVGNWTEPLGPASLWVEGEVLATLATRSHGSRRPARHPLAGGR
jgi:hypothetical protein